ncbi:MAG: hypothetical protein ACFCUU_03970 [Cyclobacteriaceae bacterium]
MKTRNLYTHVIILLSTFLSFTSCEESLLDSLDLPDEVQFTHLPVDLSQMLFFDPIGEVRGVPKMHGGFRIKEPFTFPASIPVYAMGDGYIISIEKEFRTIPPHGPPDLVGTDYDDFSLNLVYTRNAGGYYGHVSALHEDILEQAGVLREGRGNRKNVKIKITGGQIVGYLGPHEGVDIGMYDFSRESYFANPRWYGREYRSAVSYTDYLPNELRDQIWEINPRIVEPRGGKVAYDKEGTLAGNWFLEGTREITQWSRQLFFARHEVFGDRIMIVDASPLLDGDFILSGDLAPHTWWLIENQPEPESITVESGPVTFEVATWWRVLDFENPPIEGIVLVQLLDANTLQYEWFEDKLKDEISGFTSNAKIYKR